MQAELNVSDHPRENTMIVRKMYFTAVFAVACSLAASAPADEPAKIIRIGMIGLDTSHVIAFTGVLNRPNAEGLFAEMEVVAGYPGGSPDLPSSADRVDKFTEQLREKGVKIYVEPYNRYETNFINTVEQGADYVRAMDHPGIALMIDTCWMNSEDASLPGAVFKGGSLIDYVHIADSNRCYPGAGHIHFGDVIRALRLVNYQGYLTVQIDQKPEFKLVAKKSIDYLRCFI